MPNTPQSTAPPGALDATPQPDYGILFGEFARFMQKEQYNHIEPMKDTTKKVMAAVLELAANTPETKEAVEIVERLARYHVGYQRTQYEWLTTTKAHSFCVEFSGRLPIVAIHSDLCTAIVLINERLMSAFRKPEYDLTRPVLTALESSDNFFTDRPDRRTEFAA